MSKKKVIVACGGAVATSTMAAEKIKEISKEAGIDLEVVQCRIQEIDMNLSGADLIVTTSKVAKEYGVPLLHGMPFVTGLNEDALIAKVLDILKK
ncbi:MAG: PTS galactitol transporter subunit IIB [Brevinema sp.]